ncbi:hypothetical protein C0J52_20917, partial [Blattella germanica]
VSVSGPRPKYYEFDPGRGQWNFQEKWEVKRSLTRVTNIFGMIKNSWIRRAYPWQNFQPSRLA